MKYNAAIFDFDGTLADTGSDVWKSIEYAAVKLGGHIDGGFMKDAGNLGASMEDIFKAVRPTLPDRFFYQFKEEIKHHYRSVSEYPDTDLYPGIEALLLGMKKEKIPRFIVSAKPLIALERILYMKKWDVLFTGWYSQETEDGIKISKRVLIEQLKKCILAGFRPVYVGDTYTDVIAARESHIDCIAAVYGDGNVDKLLSEKPAHVILKASELEAFF